MAEKQHYTHINGFKNEDGNGELSLKEPERETFLFTSESVGEGHPGKFVNILL